MKQLKPSLHPLMDLPSSDAEARTFFTDAQISNIRRHLTKGMPARLDSKIDQALEEISIACYRYRQAISYVPSDDKVDAEWYDRFGEATAVLTELLEDGSPQTINRLLVTVAEEAGYRLNKPQTTDKKSDVDLRKRSSQQLERGLAILNQQMRLLSWWQSAAERASKGLPVGSGRREVTTPFLERSLIHELIDIWCKYRDADFVASNKKPPKNTYNVSPGQMGIAFLTVVVKEANFEFLPPVSMVNMCRRARNERTAEWKKRQEDPNHAASKALGETVNRLRKRSLTKRDMDPTEHSEEPLELPATPPPPNIQPK